MIGKARIVTFRLGTKDAKTLAEEFTLDTGDKLTKTKPGTALVEIDYRAKLLDMPRHSYRHLPAGAKRIRDHSRVQLGTPRHAVEGRIDRFIEKT